MFAYALRRIVLVLPTLLGISLIAFALTALIPDPDAAGGGSASTPAEAVEERRARFLDLPRFFNSSPEDVASRTRAEVQHIAKGDAEAEAAGRRLVATGAAALPTLLDEFPLLPTEQAGRVARAFAPVAARMGLFDEKKAEERATRVAFWERFWEDRSLDFAPSSVARSVDRLVRYGTALRETDALVEDTTVLPSLMTALETGLDREAVERLTRVANHVTGRGYVISKGADARALRRGIEDWREWWFIHRTDFVRVEGFDRLVATVTDTRYGRWLLRALTTTFGVNRETGEPVADELSRTIPVTLFMTTVAILLSLALSIPFGVVSAWRRGKAVDVLVGGLLFLLYSLPTFWIALVFRRALVSSDGHWHGASALRIAIPIITLSLTSVAVLARAERASMLEVLGEDWIRTARAKGVSELRAIVVHALRNSLLPTISLAGLLFPSLLGASFVVESVFDLPGLGLATLRAAARHDHTWVMASVLFAGTASAFGLVASDIAAAIADPRMRDLLVHPNRGLR